LDVELELRLIAHESGHIVAKGYDARAGEGCKIDDLGGFFFESDIQTIGKDQSAFGIGVMDFDGFTAAGRQDIAEFEGIPGDEVFDQS
jgi:hypothetical protein